MIVLASPEISILDFTSKAVLPAVSVCYDLFDGDATRVPRVINKNKHYAILRHGFASVKISNISRLIGRQLLRKSHADYLELSQRYVDVSDFKFIMPKKIAEDPIKKALFEKAVNASQKDYAALRAAGATKEDARYVLSQAIETKIVMSGNLQMWWDFFNLRISNRVQHECRIAAEKILIAFAGKSDIFKHHPKLALQ